jgi:hypothetical protein
MRVIAGWSRLEVSMATIAVTILGDRADSATAALYASLTTNNPQMNALQNIADDALEAPLAELFTALLRISASISKQRTPIAHGVWAISPQMPDAALNIPLQAAIEIQIAFQAYVKAGGALSPSPPIKSPGNDKIRTYKAADFHEIINRIEKHLQSFALFAALLIIRRESVPKADQLYAQICNEPEVAQALHRLRQDKKSSPEESPWLPYGPVSGDDP